MKESGRKPREQVETAPVRELELAQLVWSDKRDGGFSRDAIYSLYFPVHQCLVSLFLFFSWKIIVEGIYETVKTSETGWSPFIERRSKGVRVKWSKLRICFTSAGDEITSAGDEIIPHVIQSQIDVHKMNHWWTFFISNEVIKLKLTYIRQLFWTIVFWA